MRSSTRGSSGPMLRAMSSRRHRLTWLEALLLVATTNILIVVVGAALVMRTDPHRYPRFAIGVWWAVTTITTVGYGDVVPVSDAGRLVAGVLMFTGIGSFAFLSAVAASAIVVREVDDEEREIELEERDILRVQEAILARLGDVDRRLERLEHALEPGAESRASQAASAPTIHGKPGAEREAAPAAGNAAAKGEGSLPLLQSRAQPRERPSLINGSGGSEGA